MRRCYAIPGNMIEYSPMTITELELRVATLEQKLAYLTENVDSPASTDTNAWIDQIHGTFQNDTAYRQAARLGREWRKSHHRPALAGSRKARAQVILLDTDIFSLLELPDSPQYARLRARIAQLDPPQPVATTIVTYEEQSRGRLAMVNAARTTRQLVQAYAHLRQHLLNYNRIPIIDFDDAAGSTASTLVKSKLRLGTMDIRIAAIALTHDALLLSRNFRNFQRVPNLRVEDWTKL